MVTNTLCKSFQKLGLTANRAVLARYCSTSTSKIASNSPALILRPDEVPDKTIYEPKFQLSIRPAILDIGLPRNPITIGKIHEFPIDNKNIIGEPPKLEHGKEDTVNDKTLDLPTNGAIIEKNAVTMIVIRRRKMRIHKLKKLRKRMRAEWSIKKQRREMKKEKAFHAELLAQIRKAEAFKPEEYIAGKFAQLDHVRLPSKYKGVHMPESQIREFLEKDRIKRESKLNRPNKPRLTL